MEFLNGGDVSKVSLCRTLSVEVGNIGPNKARTQCSVLQSHEMES